MLIPSYQYTKTTLPYQHDRDFEITINTDERHRSKPHRIIDIYITKIKPFNVKWYHKNKSAKNDTIAKHVRMSIKNMLTREWLCALTARHHNIDIVNMMYQSYFPHGVRLTMGAIKPTKRHVPHVYTLQCIIENFYRPIQRWGTTSPVDGQAPYEMNNCCMSNNVLGESIYRNNNC